MFEMFIESLGCLGSVSNSTRQTEGKRSYELRLGLVVSSTEYRYGIATKKRSPCLDAVCVQRAPDSEVNGRPRENRCSERAADLLSFPIIEMSS